MFLLTYVMRHVRRRGDDVTTPEPAQGAGDPTVSSLATAMTSSRRCAMASESATECVTRTATDRCSTSTVEIAVEALPPPVCASILHRATGS